MTSDRTPADVIAAALSVGRGVTNSPQALAARVLDALAAAGFRVVPIPDDNTRALAARLRDDADRYEDTARKMGPLGWGWQRQADDLRDAAALLDGQPQDRPATCPTCGSDDPDYCNTDGERHRFGSVISESCCPDSWHVGSSGDTR